jgi:hypothetical protein
MAECPFCRFPNADGAPFCEQCKLELAPAAAEPGGEGGAARAAPSRAVETVRVVTRAGRARGAGEPGVAGVAVAPNARRLPDLARPVLAVLRGVRCGVCYPLLEGHNFVGRYDEQPVDIDLEDQEPPDRTLSSRQHAVITYQDRVLVIEDLNSTNGTFVNRTRVHPGEKRPLQAGDVVQIGTVQLQVRV